MANGRISATQALNSENFYQLPKVIIGTKYYSTLQAEAKLLFMLCRDRMSLSLDSTRNGDTRFIDENGDIFIFYSIEELMNDLGCGRAKVIKLKKELIKFNLIDEVRQGLNKANRIYVKNAITDINILNKDFEAKEVKEVEKPFNDTEVRKSNFQKFENQTSRSSKIELPEVRKSNSTNTEYTKTENNKNKTIDTYRYENESLSTLSDSAAFKMGEHSFLTDKTVKQLSLFGKQAKILENKIFQAKRAVEKEYRALFKNQVITSIYGDHWASDLNREVEKFIFKVKTSEHEGKPIKNLNGYFYKQMVHFWKTTLLIEQQVDFLKIKQLSEINKSDPEEIPILTRYFYPDKMSEKEINQELLGLIKS